MTSQIPAIVPVAISKPNQTNPRLVDQGARARAELTNITTTWPFKVFNQETNLFIRFQYQLSVEQSDEPGKICGRNIAIYKIGWSGLLKQSLQTRVWKNKILVVHGFFALDEAVAAREVFSSYLGRAGGNAFGGS